MLAASRLDYYLCVTVWAAVWQPKQSHTNNCELHVFHLGITGAERVHLGFDLLATNGIV